MSQNLISAELDSAAMDTIRDSINSLKAQLGFLIDLNIEDRRTFAKLGDASQAFVGRARDIADNHSDILPGRFNLDEFNRDVDLFYQLKQIQNLLSPLMDKLDDSLLASGSDAYSQALEVYGYAKAAGTGEGLDELRRAMSRRFRGNGRRTSPQDAVAEED